MKRLFLLILSFMFLGGAVSSSAFFINNGINIAGTQTSGGGNSQSDILENDDNVTANAPTNDGFWTDAGNYATSFAGGSGTSTDPYLISTPQQLAYLSYLINTSSTNSQYRSLYYEQTANLNMSAYWWDAIGTSSRYFSGNYNGGGYTISGLYTEAGTTSTYSYQGLFGYVSGGDIHDVGITNSEIQGYNWVGGIAGYASSYSTIADCYNAGSVSGSDFNVGGIAGYASSSTIADCYNAGSVSGLDINVGGIVGNNFATIYNCYNIGTITVDSSNNVGGVAGSNHGTIYNCYNSGTISGVSYAGGVAGQNLDEIYNCYNDGVVSGTNCIGGITGYAYCSGGMVGFIKGPFVYNCYNKGEITGIDYIGGIAGRGTSNYSEGPAYFYNCYNLGRVSADSYVGGIAGHVYSYCGVFNCFNMGDVEFITEYGGGIVGYRGDMNSQAYTVNYNYWGGDCTLSDAIGGGYDWQFTDENETCTENEAKSESWFLNSSNWYSEYPWDFENTWSIVEGMNDGYPILMPTLEIMQFTITYHPNGASGSEVVESKVGNASYTIRSNMFTRSGYNFTGWNTEANGGGTSYSAGSSYSELANLDLYAQWSRITYTIKYNKNASDATGSMANTTKYYGTNVTLRSNAFKRTGYSFAGWATSSGGAVVYANGATYSANASVTLYAKWTAHKYTVKFNGNGSTSGSMSNQTFTYGTAQKLTSNAFKKTGFTFSKWTRNADGTGTSYTNGQSVKNLTSTDGAEINLWAQWKARNEAKYDSAGKYWYVENGKIPQTKVTNSTLISNLNKATTNGSNYYIAGQTLTAKVYSGKEYCKWNNNWYEVEPIKWRLDYSSSQTDGYGTTTDTNAVLAEIVYVDQYSSSSIDAGEGYSNQSVTDFMRNGISTTYLVNYATSTQTFGTGASLYGTNASTTARMFVSSQSEINAVNGTMNMTFSDLVEDMIKYYGGTNVYFTRDLGSNYNNIVCFNEVGREVQRFATDYRGLQFTVRFTEYGCVN